MPEPQWSGRAPAKSSGDGGPSPGAASVIGPYPVAFDDANIQADGVALGPFLEVGTVVIDVYAAVTAAFFTGSTNGYFQLGVVKGDPANGDTRSLVRRSGELSEFVSGGWLRMSGYSPGFTGPVTQALVTAADAVKLYVVVVVDALPAIEGEADIYALVATL